ncbi:MAG: hypothetical protein ACREBC_21880, partial [Pyrinomonadaceae bacterium]
MMPLLATSAAKSIEDLLEAASVQAAFHFFETHSESITEAHVRVCTIPAPPFGEKQRADHVCRTLFEIGLIDSQIDEEGNCRALRPGRSQAPLLVVSAH